MLAAAGAARAQGSAASAPGSSLTMEEAVALARRNNPDYLQTANNRRVSDAARRSAYGALFPSLNTSLSAQYQQGGRQIFNGTALGASSNVQQSSYNLGLSYRINSATLLGPRLERANSNATEADITGAAANLRAAVRQQYLTALQSEARATLQDSLVLNARVQLELAKARAAVGAGTQLDVQRAEVALGQQQVQQIQARNQVEVDKLRLFQQIGVPQPAGVRLTSAFTGVQTPPALSALLELARQQNPTVLALRSRENAADVNVARTRAEYTPTLTLSTGIGGYTYQYADPSYPVNAARAQFAAQNASCMNQQRLQQLFAANGMPGTPVQCTLLDFTDAVAARIRAQNNQFPFNFTNAPRSISAVISLPLFDGFAREQRVQAAQVQREDARYTVRARELALVGDVTAAYLTLNAAAETIRLQEQNAAKARQELNFVQDQYSVGISTFVDLTTSRAAYERAETDRINAVFDYQKALAALESAVGRPLR